MGLTKRVLYKQCKSYIKILFTTIRNEKKNGQKCKLSEKKNRFGYSHDFQQRTVEIIESFNSLNSND